MLNELARIATDYTTTMRTDPGQAKYTLAWLHARKRSTVELRVPWVPFRVISVLDAHLTRTSRVAEFGGGGSTLWFADRVAEVVSIEHDLEWYGVLQEGLKDVPNSTLRYRSAQNDYAEYVSALDDYPNEYFDVIVIDGRERVRCYQAAIPKVAPGGLIVLDDTERARYSAAFEMTEWQHVTYRGLTPTQTRLGQSTVWTRPMSDVRPMGFLG